MLIPSYIKTPVFKKNNRYYKKEKYKQNTKNWDVQGDFKKTELQKSQTNVEAEFDKIRLLLNKLTITVGFFL